MSNAQAIAEACPVCGSDTSCDFTGRDFMFGTPGGLDYVVGKRKGSSKKSSLRRLRARALYVWPGKLTGLGDKIFVIFDKKN